LSYKVKSNIPISKQLEPYCEMFFGLLGSEK